MRYQMNGALIAAGLFAMTALGNPVLGSPPNGEPSTTLAQVTPAPTVPAPNAGAQPQTSGPNTSMPGQMMEHGKGMEKGMGPMMGGQGRPGLMGGMPACPAGKTMSGTPPTCN